MAQPYHIELMKRGARDVTEWRKNLGGKERLDLSGADLSGMDLTEIDFTGGDLTGAVFDNANISGALFHDADLSGASFCGAVSHSVGRHVVFHNATMRNAKLNNSAVQRQ